MTNVWNAIIRITKTPNFISTAGNLVVAILGFLSFLIMARTLKQPDFGKYMIYLSGMSLIEMIRTGLTGTPLVRFLSGAISKEEESRLIGASWVLNLIITAFFVIVMWGTYLLFKDALVNKGFDILFLWYPVLAIINLPYDISYSVLQARKDFKNISILAGLNSLLFLLFLVVNFFMFNVSFIWIIIAHQLSFLVLTFLSMANGWASMNTFRHATRKSVMDQLKFGKYSLFTLLGSNLLRSSDTFIIGIMMTAPEVAFYSVPLKLIEVVEIPLRSIVAVVFPTISKASRNNDLKEVRSIYYANTGVMTLLFIPFIILLFFITKPLILIYGGPEYVDSYVIYWVFLIYALILPMDRFSGITLDAINKPNYNMIKVVLMVTANVIGDVIVIHLWSSLPAVAACTILNAIVGVIVGNIMLNKLIGTKLYMIFPYGWSYLRYLVKPFITRNPKVT